MRKTDQDAAEEYAARLQDAHLQAKYLLSATSGLLCLQQNTIGYKWLKDVYEKHHFIIKHDLVGLGSNPGESMDVCKCIVPLQHWDTPNSHRAASPLVTLVEGEERWEASDHLWMFSLKSGVEPSKTVLSPT
ncbi:hypothetical protein TNCV_1182561 [Trichonephila clavipes]|nr:hypothetical protein TNCV_1182561 [Trichonephila clavipes]